MPQERLVKLVRDLIPEHLADSQVEYRPVRDNETVRKELRKKLGEEVAEYLIDGGIEELADVLSVVLALSEWEGYTREALFEKMLAKNERKGPISVGMGMYVQTLTVEEYDAKKDAE